MLACTEMARSLLVEWRSVKKQKQSRYAEVWQHSTRVTSQLNEVFGERDPQIDDAVLLVLVIENGSLSI